MREQPISKSEWTEVALGDVVENINEYFDRDNDEPSRYIAGEHVDEGKLTISRWGMTDDDFFPPTFKRRFRAGDVLFHSRNIKKVASPDFDGVTGEKLFVLRVKAASLLMQDLLPFLLSGADFFEYAEQNWSGSVNKFFNWRPLANYRFYLPPLQEQARLVELFAAQRSAEETLLCSLQKLSDLRISYIGDLLGSYRSASDRVLVENLLIDGPTNGRSPAPSDSETGFKTVSISAIRDGIFDPEGCIKFVEMTAAEARPFIVQSDDIFAVRGNGNRDICGRVGISRQTYPELVYPDLLIRMRFDPSRLLTDFVVAQWNHPAAHGRLISRAKSSNGIWKVNGQDIRAHTLVVPPMRAQREAVQFLRALDMQAAAINARFATLRDMKRELFKAISGGAE
ncbi:hypothetical protein U8P71_04885 [Rhizobium ruizarguesonis]|uniref:hypothetical protein n=1 Tax=Rhizobium ruizarguesonis TaxID=2081791 RepID=UPI001031BDA7|nr:hypothetical protein [Rhizobium ruizarguesonis]TBE31675.1 hypothetical protein ELH07_02680 [Rhizobium ruizarguesonis]WSH02367.1 hypothetical protein U8P71_04885 [Rhizobium ruizarguesonis]